ncbi:hypothetical protein TSUD_366210 [Trifolium subterraneum]|uniref:Uncharacterized protein n=1 Tax=Trifolium subterraneum TaxID=3900 RepID=A0A2Z6PI81_TRISU|nr:hypothetical protein TSUD_366210 [Trifolium subterraneum]
MAPGFAEKSQQTYSRTFVKAIEELDYEPGGFYSESQIKKARDSFNPIETLDFVKELAFAPLDGDHGSFWSAAVASFSALECVPQSTFQAAS